MFGSKMIEVAVGLTFFYVLLALICSTINEWIVMLTKLRAKNLEKGIKALLEDSTSQDLAQAVYGHPLITGLAKKGYKPSYISSKNFTRVLLDVLKQTDPEKLEDSSDDIRKNIKRMQDGKLKKSLTLLVDEAGDNVIQARRNIETWYDDSMERISGWYKRKVRWFILAIALAVTVSMNADTFRIANTLYNDAELRASVMSYVDESQHQIQQQSEQEEKADISELVTEVKSMQLPIGWSKNEFTVNGQEYPKGWALAGNIGLKILGLLFTAFAASLGAPFWFDMLNKFNSLRGSGGRPQKAEDLPQKA